MQQLIAKPINSLILFSQILTGIIFILIMLMYALEFFKPNQRYFTTTNAVSGITSQDNVEIFPLLEPNVSAKSLLRWATLAATTAYTLDFVNYEDSLAKVKPFFTQAGFNNFRQALDSSNRLKDIIDKKLIVSAVADGNAVLLNEGNLNGFYSWRIQVPLLITYQGASEKSTKQNIVITLLITRVPTTDTITGIGIAQILDSTINEL